MLNRVQYFATSNSNAIRHIVGARAVRQRGLEQNAHPVGDGPSGVVEQGVDIYPGERLARFAHAPAHRSMRSIPMSSKFWSFLVAAATLRDLGNCRNLAIGLRDWRPGGPPRILRSRVPRHRQRAEQSRETTCRRRVRPPPRYPSDACPPAETRRRCPPSLPSSPSRTARATAVDSAK